jgi:hypothetical protein
VRGKRQRDVAALEVGLAIEVRRVGEHPPPAVGAVHVPDFVPDRADELGGGELDVDDVFVSLAFNVGADLLLVVLSIATRRA